MAWLKKWLLHEPKPAPPAHRCHFVKRYWIGGKPWFYVCECGMVYGPYAFKSGWGTGRLY